MRAASVAGIRIPATLVEAVVGVRATHPGSLETLAAAVQATADTAARDLVSAPADVLQLAQGRAQAWRALAELLSNPEQARKQLDQR